MYLFPFMIGIPLVFGVMMIIPIGGADMPTVISLLNSYAGLSAAAMGFVLRETLIIAGRWRSVGLHPFGETCRRHEPVVHERAVWRVWTGTGDGGGGKEARPVRSASPEEGGRDSDGGEQVVIVPGYGMAVAQAQHKVRDCMMALTKRGGGAVNSASHPVGGTHAGPT